jgi:hypothetical protein
MNRCNGTDIAVQDFPYGQRVYANYIRKMKYKLPKPKAINNRLNPMIIK